MTRRRTRPERATAPDTLEVWLDADLVNRPHLVGLLSHDAGHVRFRYEPAWLTHPARFVLDPDLSLDRQVFFPRPRQSSFGIFLDSSPDRWGQVLMDRRESLRAQDEGRRPRTLRAWDYLIGVQDDTRQGALRFRYPGTDAFLAAEPWPVPPITSLPALERVAFDLSRREIDDLDELRRWLAVLVAPGSSLGGARPKANVTEHDGSLWIAKFPSHADTRDVGAWEMLAHILARRAGVVVSDARLARTGKGYRTFCTRRFDRAIARQDARPTRVFYASALTMTGRPQSEGASYLDLAWFLTTHGDPDHLGGDLEQLFRRVLFNVVVGNRDDHLRNHGFILTRGGWRPAPAFDINPDPDRAEHVLALDDRDPRPNVATVLATAELYRLAPARASAIADEIQWVVSGWRPLARRLRIPAADVTLMAGAIT